MGIQNKQVDRTLNVGAQPLTVVAKVERIFVAFWFEHENDVLWTPFRDESFEPAIRLNNFLQEGIAQSRLGHGLDHTEDRDVECGVTFPGGTTSARGSDKKTLLLPVVEAAQRDAGKLQETFALKPRPLPIKITRRLAHRTIIHFCHHSSRSDFSVFLTFDTIIIACRHSLSNENVIISDS